ncbi:MAG: type II toxin-antitoxin system mRNA interferase toxin, RelE/StbE family [Candidatus Omnitrophica bacterium]|nr:type II toxin-antitoxin system mRNA interferase toxin, RelE/StbE family [Candidatus Omnitrophota bacterium]
MTRRAEKDIRKLSPKLKNKLYDILTEVIAPDPFCDKELIGDLEGSFSYPLTYKDRIIYSVDKKKKTVFLERARTHYDD